jgi:hypothetical protein
MAFMDTPAVKALLDVSAFRTDGGTQSRERMSRTLVVEYRDQMKDGAVFPPLQAFFDGTCYWLIDGFHRLEGAKQADIAQLYCMVHEGTLEQARWECLSSNATNSLHRSNRDKAFAIRLAFAHPISAGLSDRAIGAHVGVDHVTVGHWRAKLTGEIHQSTLRKGADGRTTNVANIGSAFKPAVASNPVSVPVCEAFELPPEPRTEAPFTAVAEPCRVPNLPGLGSQPVAPPAPPASKPPALSQYLSSGNKVDPACERLLELVKEAADMEISGDDLFVYLDGFANRYDAASIRGYFRGRGRDGGVLLRALRRSQATRPRENRLVNFLAGSRHVRFHNVIWGS